MCKCSGERFTGNSFSSSLINEGHYPYVYPLAYSFAPAKYANQWNLHISGRQNCKEETTKGRRRRVQEATILVKISGLNSYRPTGLLYPSDRAKKTKERRKKKDLILKLE